MDHLSEDIPLRQRPDYSGRPVSDVSLHDSEASLRQGGEGNPYAAWLQAALPTGGGEPVPERRLKPRRLSDIRGHQEGWEAMQQQQSIPQHEDTELDVVDTYADSPNLPTSATKQQGTRKQQQQKGPDW